MSKDENGTDVMVGQAFALTNYKSESGIQLGAEDIIMPRLSLIQNTNQDSKNNKDAGTYYFQLTDEVFETVNVILFKNTLGRIMFDPDRAKAQAICGSSDRIDPSARFDPPQANHCNECKFSRPRFVEEVDIGAGVKKPKTCDDTIPVIGCFEDTLMPFLFTAKRTAATVMREFLSSIAFQINLTNVARKVKQLPLISLHNYVVGLSSKLVTKKGNSYYIPQMKIVKRVEDESFNAIFEGVKNYDFDRTFESEQEKESEPVVEMDSEKVI